IKTAENHNQSTILSCTTAMCNAWLRGVRTASAAELKAVQMDLSSGQDEHVPNRTLLENMEENVI
ncbi:unnamed protein product, partial [Amoebophrya sp. A25]